MDGRFLGGIIAATAGQRVTERARPDCRAKVARYNQPPMRLLTAQDLREMRARSAAAQGEEAALVNSFSNRPITFRTVVRTFIYYIIICALDSSVEATEPARNPQLKLRAWVAEGLSSGWIQFEKPFMEVKDGTLHWMTREPQGDLPGFVKSQVMVQAIRNAFPGSDARAWWEPHLQSVEKLIADEIAYRTTTPALALDVERLASYRQLQHKRLNEVGRSYANALGLKFADVQRAEARALESVILTTSHSGDTIMLIPRSKYLIAQSAGETPSFESIAAGSNTRLTGAYAYKIRHPDGSETEVKFFEVRQGGTFRLD
jgi:hypothetical protein